MLNILFVHQSAELYGSDKVLLSLAQGLDRRRFRPIVLLPCEGPLMAALKESGIEVYVVPVIKVSRATLRLGGLVRLPWEIWRSLRAMSQALMGTSIDLVHSNTLAVLSGALWAKWRGLPHIWHVHEMIVQPKFVRHLFPWLLRVFADKVPCNSHATKQLLLESQPILANKISTIWNGMDRESPPTGEQIKAEFRRKLGLSEDDLLVVLMGRINRWKGQSVLVDAAVQLRQSGLCNLHFLIVGSAPMGQEHFVVELTRKIQEANGASYISLMDFQQDIWRVWDSCDIAVVPSTEPEPFGMVALEAMAARKPVIAAGHGGLLDIVVDKVTGRLVKPNNVSELASAIEGLAQDRVRRDSMGREGEARLRDVFSLQRYVSSFESLYELTVAKSKHG